MDRTTTSIPRLSHDSESQLPVEILSEIFLKLPVKTLMKMKCVSKSWYSLISSPLFVKTHLKISTKNQDLRLLFSGSYENKNPRFYTSIVHAIMYQKSRHWPVELDFPYKDQFGCYKVEGSCDGLLCISVGSGDVFLWNPSIRKLKKLPFLGENYTPTKVEKITLFRSIHFDSAYGFGYNVSQDDYKVVKIERSHKLNEFGEFELLNNVNVYSLRTNSWEMIPEKFPSVCFRNDPAKFVNGRLHWIARHRGNIVPWFIASLNLVDLTYEEVALPPCVDDGNIKRKLGNLGGKLCVFCHCNNILMDVWIMMENGVVESWTKVVSVPYLVELDFALWPIFISQNDDILLQCCSSLLMYNSTHNDLKETKTQIHYGSRVQFSLYIESLVSPNFVEEV